MAGEHLNDVDFLLAMVRHFGPKRSAQVIGTCIVWQLMGARTYREIERMELGERSTWYRVRADLKGFRDYLVSLGEEPEELNALRLRVARAGRVAA